MRRHFTLCSVVAHAVVITAALISQQLAVGALPTPHQPVLFEAADFMPADTRLPAPPRRTEPDRTAHSESGPTSVDAAPTVEPAAVTPESDRGNAAPQPGLVGGVENGAGSGIDGIVSGNALPPPAPPVPQRPIRLHAGMTAPRKMVDVAPVYPPVAQRARIEVVVILEAVIDAAGHVASSTCCGIALLDQAAVDAVAQWRFTPAPERSPRSDDRDHQFQSAESLTDRSSSTFENLRVP